MTHFRKAKTFKEWRKQKVLKEHEEKKLKSIDRKISKDTDVNVQALQKILGKETEDVIIRRFHIGGHQEFKAAAVMIDGLIDNAIVDNFILRAGMFETRAKGPEETVAKETLLQIIKKYSLVINEIEETKELRKAISHILNGDTAIFIQGSEKAFCANTKGWEQRSVEEPRAERVVRGPREGFTETLRVNTALLRRRLRDPDLRMKHMSVGERTNTDVTLAYIEGLCEGRLLNQIEKRIKKINMDAILGSGYIEQMIEDSHWSPFPTIQYTERPDKAAANVLEGKVAIIVDGTPFVLIAPAVFSQFYQSPEDYYERFWISTFIRFVRMFSLFIALLAPSLYIAFTTFHPEMVPSDLLIAIAAGRSTVPFPAIIEAFIMEISIEILREASIRLPGIIGPTIGIVGALVIGQAAVQAGLVSPLMVIIVSLTTIASFTFPSYNASIAIRLLRFPMMIMAGVFGLYGIMLLIILIILHLCTLKSFGVPYLAPLSPTHFLDMKDIVFRAPLQWMSKRPVTMIPEDDYRGHSDGMGGES